MDKKNIIIIVLVAICLVLGWVAFGRPEPSTYDEKLVKRLQDSLSNQNKTLLKEIATERQKTASYMRRYDSLGQLPPKIKIQYEKAYKSVDNASNHAIIVGFDSIFTNAGINK